MWKRLGISIRKFCFLQFVTTVILLKTAIFLSFRWNSIEFIIHHATPTVTSAHCSHCLKFVCSLSLYNRRDILHSEKRCQTEPFDRTMCVPERFLNFRLVLELNLLYELSLLYREPTCPPHNTKLIRETFCLRLSFSGANLNESSPSTGTHRRKYIMNVLNIWAVYGHRRSCKRNSIFKFHSSFWINAFISTPTWMCAGRIYTRRILASSVTKYKS